MKKSFSALATIFFMTSHSMDLAGGQLSHSSENPQRTQAEWQSSQREVSYHKTLVKEFQASDAIPVQSYHEERDGGSHYAGHLALIGVRQVSDRWLATYSGDLVLYDRI